MAERWQQWMPFHIDRWRGSPSVQAMHPAAQMGYLNLLLSCWQSFDCSLADDAIDLATESRLGDELWALYGARILRKFVLIAGKWRNEVQFREWVDSRRVYEKRKSGAVRTNTSRSANGERTQSSRNTDTQTLTGTLTTTKDLKAKDLALTPSGIPASPPVFTMKLTGNKNHIVTQADMVAYHVAYPGIDIYAELRKIPPWLDANPEKRSASVNGSKQRIVKWLTRAQNQISTVKNGGSNGAHQSNTYETRGDRILREAIALGGDEEAEVACGDDGISASLG